MRILNKLLMIVLLLSLVISVSGFSGEVKTNLLEYQKLLDGIDEDDILDEEATYLNIVAEGYYTITWEDSGSVWCHVDGCLENKDGIIDAYLDSNPIKRCVDTSENYHCCIPEEDRGFYENVMCNGDGVKDERTYSSRFIKPKEEDSQPLPPEFINGITDGESTPVFKRTISVNPKANLNCYIPLWSKVYLYFGEDKLFNGLYLVEHAKAGSGTSCEVNVFLGVGENDYLKYKEDVGGSETNNPRVYLLDEEGNVITGAEMFGDEPTPKKSASVQGSIHTVYKNQREIEGFTDLTESTKEFAVQITKECLSKDLDKREECVKKFLESNKVTEIEVVNDCIDPAADDYEKIHDLKQFSLQLSDCATSKQDECFCEAALQTDIVGLTINKDILSYGNIEKEKSVQNAFGVYLQDVTKTGSIEPLPSDKFSMLVPLNRQFLFKKTKENNFIHVVVPNEPSLKECVPENNHYLFCSYLVEDKRDVQKYIIAFISSQIKKPSKVLLVGDSTVDDELKINLQDKMGANFLIDFRRYSSCNMDHLKTCLTEGYDSTNADCKHMCGGSSSEEVQPFDIKDYDTIAVFMTMNEVFGAKSDNIKEALVDITSVLKVEGRNTVLVTNWPWKGPTGSYDEAYILAKEELNTWIMNQEKTNLVDVSVDIYSDLEDANQDGEIDVKFFDKSTKQLNSDAKKLIADLLAKKSLSYKSVLHKKYAETVSEKFYFQNALFIGDDIISDGINLNEGFIIEFKDKTGSNYPIRTAPYYGCTTDLIFQCLADFNSNPKCSQSCENSYSVGEIDISKDQIDTVIINAGINDLMQGKKADDIIKNYESAIEFLEEKGVNIVIMTVSPWGSFQGYNGKFESTQKKQTETSKLNNHLESLSNPENGIYVINIHRNLAETGTFNLKALYDTGIGDGLHFGPEGHTVLSGLLYDSIFFDDPSKKTGKGIDPNNVQAPSYFSPEQKAKFETAANNLLNNHFDDGQSWFEYAVKTAEREGIPPAIFLGMITQESVGKNSGMNSCGAIGTTQVLSYMHYGVIRDTCGYSLVQECEAHATSCDLSKDSGKCGSMSCDPSTKEGLAKCDFTKYSGDVRCQLDVGAKVLKSKYMRYSKLYTCREHEFLYSGWEAALRGYNGWGCTDDDEQPVYVENVMIYANAWGYAGVPSSYLAGQKIPITLREPLILRFAMKI